MEDQTRTNELPRNLWRWRVWVYDGEMLEIDKWGRQRGGHLVADVVLCSESRASLALQVAARWPGCVSEATLLGR